MKPEPAATPTRHADGDALAWIDDELAALSERDLLRNLRTHRGAQGVRLVIDGRELINFGSNDYLGLAADERITRAVSETLAQEGWGAGASPLVTGHGESHRRLEAALADFKGAEAALVFSSGFAANAGTIAALVGRGDTVFGDELNHASLIDGCRLSRAEVQVYPHRDVAALEEQLRASSAARRRLIVTDSVFSMDGDLAPLVELAELADHYGAMLMVDEAHATGVFGANGRGLAEARGVESRVDVSVGTLSKALGSVGGFVSGRQSLIEWLVNRARTYIFSTALPAAACAAALAGLEIVRQEPGRREQLLDRVHGLRGQLAGQGWLVGASASQIIPIVVGSEAGALSLGSHLQAAGLLVPAIRPPSVPAGKSLLRISVSSAHTVPMIDSLLAALAPLASADSGSADAGSRADSGSRDGSGSRADLQAPSPFGRRPG